MLKLMFIFYIRTLRAKQLQPTVLDVVLYALQPTG